MEYAGPRGISEVVVYVPGVEWEKSQGTPFQMTSALTESTDVIWVDPPRSLFRILREKRWRSLLRPPISNVAPNLTLVTNVSPPLVTNKIVRELVELSIGFRLRRYLRRRSIRPIATIVSAPGRGYYDLYNCLRVYFATDDFVAGADLMGLSAKTVAADEAKRIGECDLLVAVSTTILTGLQAVGKRAVVIRNGCSPSLRDAVLAASDYVEVSLPGPVVGLVGQLNDRIDLEFLEVVVARGHSVLLVGPLSPTLDRVRFEKLLQRDNVQWLGPKPRREIPSIMRSITVGITPYTSSRFNHASSPVKTLEYLAAGVGVVSSELSGTREFATDLISLGGTPAEFADAVAAELARERTTEHAARSLHFAGENSWSIRAALMMKEIRTSRLIKSFDNSHKPVPETKFSGAGKIIDGWRTYGRKRRR